MSSASLRSSGPRRRRVSHGRASHARRAAAGPVGEAGDRGRDQDDEADDDREEIGGPAEQVETVLQDGEHQQPEQHAADRADAAAEARPAQHRRRQHAQLLPTMAFGHALADAVRLDEAGEPGHEAEKAVGEVMHPGDADAEPARGFGVAAHAIELASGGSPAHQEPGGDARRRRRPRSASVMRISEPSAAWVWKNTMRSDHQSGSTGISLPPVHHISSAK